MRIIMKDKFTQDNFRSEISWFTLNRLNNHKLKRWKEFCPALLEKLDHKEFIGEI